MRGAFGEQAAALLAKVRETAPLVHNITNFVVMNSSANILLALGAAPVMAHSRDEVIDMVKLAGALVLNIGTLEEEWVESMLMAAQAANAAGIPVIIDPVGAGATPYRTACAQRLLREARIAVIRGNAGEMSALLGSSGMTRGVDALAETGTDLAARAATLARQTDCIVSMSGAEDFVSDGTTTYVATNGVPLMTKVTGLGCGLSSVTGAFVAIGPDRLFAAAAAVAVYGLCGELALTRAQAPASFATAFIDTLYTITSQQVTDGVQLRTV